MPTAINAFHTNMSSIIVAGEQLGDHWLLNKDGFFEQSYHIPLIIRCPTAATMQQLSGASQSALEQARGRVVTEFTEHVDIVPTILECAGLSVPVQVDGSSLLPFLLGRPAPSQWRSAAHWEFDYRDRNPPAGAEPSSCSLCVVRGPRWKYVQFSDPNMVTFSLSLSLSLCPSPPPPPPL